MRNLNRSAKTFLYISILSGILWLGAYLIKLFLLYYLFQEKDFALKTYLNNQNLPGILSSFLPLFATPIILFSIFIIFFILFLVTGKISLKVNGWLFISTILIFITCPFEIYLMTIDYKIFSLLNSGKFIPGEIIHLIIKRFTVFSSFSIIEIACYAAVVFLFVFQPLKKVQIEK